MKFLLSKAPWVGLGLTVGLVIGFFIGIGVATQEDE